jgi:branched-chain amino acid transport system ATP-binding protein
MRFLRPAERYEGVAERTERALDRCGISARRTALAGQLSYGEQRQLEIAMVLATEPTVLLLDEPLAGLGHDEALRVVDLLRGISRGRTVILVEHDMDAVFSISDTVTVLVDGRVLETGSPELIRKSPRVRDAYLGEEVA